MSERLEFNLNSKIHAKLTVKAAEYLLKEHADFWCGQIGSESTISQIDQYNQFIFDYIPPRVDENGYTSFMAWDFMSKFGQLMQPGFYTKDYFLDIQWSDY